MPFTLASFDQARIAFEVNSGAMLATTFVSNRRIALGELSTRPKLEQIELKSLRSQN